MPKKPRKENLETRNDTRPFARRLFWSAIETEAPIVFRDLRDEVFKHYGVFRSHADTDIGFGHYGKETFRPGRTPNWTFEDIRQRRIDAPQFLAPKVVQSLDDVVAELNSWGRRWQMTHDWIMDHAEYTLFDWWVNASDRDALRSRTTPPFRLSRQRVLTFSKSTTDEAQPIEDSRTLAPLSERPRAINHEMDKLSERLAVITKGSTILTVSRWSYTALVRFHCLDDGADRIARAVQPERVKHTTVQRHVSKLAAFLPFAKPDWRRGKRARSDAPNPPLPIF